MIQVWMDRPQAMVGDVIRCGASWQLDKPPDALKLELRWHTEGRGDRDAQAVQVVQWDAGQGPIPPTVETTFQVPPGGPVSYDGQLLRVVWTINASLKVSWSRDPEQAAVLVVTPRPVAP